MAKDCCSSRRDAALSHRMLLNLQHDSEGGTTGHDRRVQVPKPWAGHANLVPGHFVVAADRPTTAWVFNPTLSTTSHLYLSP